jgi:integrase
MAAVHKLTAAHLRIKRPGTYGDGGGLWLQVTAAAGGRYHRSWTFRFTDFSGRRREMGLGPIETVSLPDAREAALQCRKQLLANVDPIEARKAERAARRVAAAKVVTFDECAHAYLAAHGNEWSRKHTQQWAKTISIVSPIIGTLPVSTIDTSLVVKALKPVWGRTPTTASRLRGRIENVLDYAVVSEQRPPGDNPARWNGHLEHIFASKPEQEHLAAMPFADVPALVQKLRGIDSTAARAVEFTILTAARRSESFGATWAEIDPDARVWTIPALRMKGRTEHRVPLSGRVIEILEEQRRRGTHPDLVFANPSTRRQFAHDMGLSLLEGHTLHGFRSSFRDWAGDRTNFPREVAEAALAHAVGNAVELSYRRSDALEKRRKLMAAWADFCSRPAPAGATVTPIGKAFGN